MLSRRQSAWLADENIVRVSIAALQARILGKTSLVQDRAHSEHEFPAGRGREVRG